MSTPTAPSDTLADPTAGRESARSGRRTIGRRSLAPRRIARWVVVVAVLAILAIIGLAIRLVGHVQGREFSPESFRLRNFTLYEVPYLEIQITPIWRNITSTDTSTYLRQKGLITTVPKSAGESPVDPTWHLVRLTRGLRGSSHRDAKILTEQLSIQTNGVHYWKSWSIDHPKKAKAFWPMIQRLAGRELYVLMPNLFEIAQSDDSLESMIEALDDRLQRDYQGMIADAKADGRDDLAEIFTEEYKSDFPDRPL